MVCDAPGAMLSICATFWMPGCAAVSAQNTLETPGLTAATLTVCVLAETGSEPASVVVRNTMNWWAAVSALLTANCEMIGRSGDVQPDVRWTYRDSARGRPCRRRGEVQRGCRRAAQLHAHRVDERHCERALRDQQEHCQTRPHCPQRQGFF